MGIDGLVEKHPQPLRKRCDMYDIEVAHQKEREEARYLPPHELQVEAPPCSIQSFSICPFILLHLDPTCYALPRPQF